MSAGEGSDTPARIPFSAKVRTMAYLVFNDTRTLQGEATSLLDMFQGDTVFLGRDAFWSATNQWNSHAISSTGYSTIRIAGQAYATHDTIYSTGAGDLIEVMTSGIVGSHGQCGIRLLGAGEARNAGEIFGYDGVWLNDGGAVNNVGRIGGERYGVSIFSSGDSRGQLVNTGSITALYGVIANSGGHTTVANSGAIHGSIFAISIGGEGGSTVQNGGTIVGGGGVAIYGGSGRDTVINGGAIVGGVVLGGGDDVFDSGRGTITGAIDGGEGDDRLTGGAAADVLIGGAGADALDGGAGRDTASYEGSAAGVTANLADSSANTGDAAGDAFASIEALVGSAFADVLVGNAGKTTLSGGAGGDRLDGGGGADVLAGGSGDDVYVVDHRGDRIVEDAGGGVDRVNASIDYVLPEWVEQLELEGAAVRGIGNAAANAIQGTSDDNILDGKEGSDVMVGWGGADRFTFSTALDGVTNVDTIADWDVGMDRLALDRAVFEGAGKKLTAGAFAIGTVATDADDRLLYDAATGDLRWDADGAGGKDAVLFAHLEGAPALQLGDVLLVG